MPENQTVDTVEYDASTDTLRVVFAGRDPLHPERSALTVAFDGGARLVHYDEAGTAILMEFPNASRNLSLAGVPHAEIIADVARAHGLPVR